VISGNQRLKAPPARDQKKIQLVKTKSSEGKKDLTRYDEGTSFYRGEEEISVGNDESGEDYTKKTSDRLGNQ
jgi:hypothetical protein